MRPVDYDEYLRYVERHDEISVEGVRIPLLPFRIKRLKPRKDELTDVSTTVWSFPKRGRWATHKGNYRGNWPPQMARALILSYTEPGDTVVDPMIGSGTTCIEAKLLGRNCIGVDINYNAVILSLHRLYWLEKYLETTLEEAGNIRITREEEPEEVRVEDSLRAVVKIYHGDARNLDLVGDESVDLVATHPPYYNIIRYSGRRSPGDLSAAGSLEEYLEMINDVLGETYRILKPGRHLGILVGDTRMRKHYVPITHHVLSKILSTGYILREEVVKIQHKMKKTREKWARVKSRDFLLIYHEKLFIARKPAKPGEYGKYRYSSLLTGAIQDG